MEGKKLIRNVGYYKLVLFHVSEYFQIQLQVILCIRRLEVTVTDNFMCENTSRYSYRIIFISKDLKIQLQVKLSVKIHPGTVTDNFVCQKN
jgi:hypothetical protein